MITVQLKENGPITEMDEALLEKHEGFVDDEIEYTTWVEYRLLGQERVIHRSAHVRLKQALSSGEIAWFGWYGGNDNRP